MVSNVRIHPELARIAFVCACGKASSLPLDGESSVRCACGDLIVWKSDQRQILISGVGDWAGCSVTVKTREPGP